MQSCIDFFWYQILVSDRTCSIRYQKLVVSGTSFWYRFLERQTDRQTDRQTLVDSKYRVM